MRRNWLILAALWILSLVGISFFGGTISYGFFAVVTMIPLASLLYLILVLARFKVYQHFECPEIVSNHVVPFYFTLQNEDWFPFSGVRVTFYSDFSSIEGLDDSIEYELLPKTKIKKETMLLCRYRGEYLVGIKAVTFRDHLCLFKITYNNREPLRATVIPDIIVLDSLKSFDAEALSDKESSAGVSHPDVTVREYTTDDDVRRINWKQTARLGKLAVRNDIGEEKDGIGIIIDTRRISSTPNIYLPTENRILEIAIALSLFLSGKNIPVCSYHYNRRVEKHIIDSPVTFNSFYEAISAASFEYTPDGNGILKVLCEEKDLFSKRMILIITAAIDDAALECAKALNENNISVIIYLVEKESPCIPKASILPHTKIIAVPAEGNLNNIL